jgi:hypothetical protein
MIVLSAVLYWLQAPAPVDAPHQGNPEINSCLNSSHALEAVKETYCELYDFIVKHGLCQSDVRVIRHSVLRGDVAWGI